MSTNKLEMNKEDECRRYKIILKSGKEFEVNCNEKRFIKNSVELNDIASTENIDIILEDESFFIRLLEIAAIIDITKQTTDDDFEIKIECEDDYDDFEIKIECEDDYDD